MLFRLADTAKDMAKLPLEVIQESISTLGLFRQKAKHVKAASQRIVDVYAGQVPSCREALQTLPGVGRKTANVVLNVAFHQPTIPVDTHVFRLARRLGLAKGETTLAVEKELSSCIQGYSWAVDVHHWLVLHGRYVCKARSPACAQCALHNICPRKGV